MIIDEDAIHSLIPNTEWHYAAGVLTVFTEGVKAPSSEEITAEKIRLEKIKAEREQVALAEKQALLNRLGITTDEAKLLLS